jgi:hypothetical protein
MVVAIGTRENRQTLIGRDYWIRVRSFCLGCGKSSASVLSRPKHTILAYP